MTTIETLGQEGERGGRIPPSRVLGFLALSIALALLPAACVPMAVSPPPAAEGGTPPDTGDLVPPGFGSLRQEQITLTLISDALQIKMTPLTEWILRLTAPDTYQRLSGLAGTHRQEIERRGAGTASTLFLVSFYSEEQGQSFRPEDLFLAHRGRRLSPVTIRPLTGGWGVNRLEQRQAQTAVYQYETIDFALDLTAEYGGVLNGQWTRIWQLLQNERALARARAGGGG